MPKGGRRKGAGRKPMGDSALVGRSVTLSLPDDNWVALDKYLHRYGLDLATFLRNLVMDHMLFDEDFHVQTKKSKS